MMALSSAKLETQQVYKVHALSTLTTPCAFTSASSD